MKLITEHFDNLQYITEDKDGKTNTFIEGVFMQAEKKNRNGRIYPKKTLFGAVEKYISEGGVKLGVSSRGMGTVENKNGNVMVNDDYTLATVDIVQDPSAQGAFVNGIMEGVEWIWDNGILKAQQLEKYETEIREASSKELASVQEKVFKDFLSKL